MNNPTPRVLWTAFLVGLLSPICAVIVKPTNYSFYMFFPATPKTWFGQLRLFTGNSLLVLGFAVALLAALLLAARAIKQRRHVALLCPLVVLANPMQQPIFLEALDNHMNYRMRDRAEQLQIIGKTPEEVRQLLGTPRVIDRDGNVTWEGKTYTTWEYQPLPFYWMGSRFQVFFSDGRVTGIEANDD